MGKSQVCENKTSHSFNYWVKEEVKSKLKKISRQTKLKTQYTQIIGCSKISTKREIYSDKHHHQQQKE